MTRLKGRLRALERAMAVRERCPVCGYGDGVPVKLTLSFDDPGGPATCTGCGRKLVLKIQLNRPLDVAEPETADGSGDGESAR